MPRRLLLDTDIGTDVDDCLALALALALSEVELAAVTTVYGDVTLRSRMVLKLLRLAGADAVRVACGADQPMGGAPSVYWAGHEGQGLLETSDLDLQPLPDHAVDLLIREVLAHPRETWLVAIGPLTNVALALLKEPAFGRALAGVTIMGGVVGALGRPELPPTEHNFRSDPEAASIVLASGLPLHLVPLDVTTQVRIGAEDVAALASTGDPLHRALAQQVELYPKYRQRGGWTYLHDPLALATVVAPDLVSWQRCDGEVETGAVDHPGRLRLNATARDGNLRIAMAVDAPRARDWIIGRLVPPRPPLASS